MGPPPRSPTNEPVPLTYFPYDLVKQLHFRSDELRTSTERIALSTSARGTPCVAKRSGRPEEPPPPSDPMPPSDLTPPSDPPPPPSSKKCASVATRQTDASAEYSAGTLLPRRGVSFPSASYNRSPRVSSSRPASAAARLPSASSRWVSPGRRGSRGATSRGTHGATGPPRPAPGTQRAGSESGEGGGARRTRSERPRARLRRLRRSRVSGGASLVRFGRQAEVPRSAVRHAELPRGEHELLRREARVVERVQHHAAHLARLEPDDVLHEHVRRGVLERPERIHEPEETLGASVAEIFDGALPREGLAGRGHEPEGRAERVERGVRDGREVLPRHAVPEVVLVHLARVPAGCRTLHARTPRP